MGNRSTKLGSVVAADSDTTLSATEARACCSADTSTGFLAPPSSSVSVSTGRPSALYLRCQAGSREFNRPVGLGVREMSHTFEQVSSTIVGNVSVVFVSRGPGRRLELFTVFICLGRCLSVCR